MSWKKYLEDASSEYSKNTDGQFQYATKWSEVSDIFKDGAEWGFAQAVEMLCSDYHTDPEGFKLTRIGEQLANWLESERSREGDGT